MYVLRALMWVPGWVFKSNRRGDGRIERSDAKCRWPHLMLYIKTRSGGCFPRRRWSGAPMCVQSSMLVPAPVCVSEHRWPQQ